MAQLNNCQHCGSEVVFLYVDQGAKRAVFAQCASCKIQTQPISESTEYSAVDKIADIWNSTSANEWPEWVQPKGGHDAYSKGSKVSYSGSKWISNIDANVWAPGVTGWTKQ